jgi:hypothetical protein
VNKISLAASIIDISGSPQIERQAGATVPDQDDARRRLLGTGAYVAVGMPGLLVSRLRAPGGSAAARGGISRVRWGWSSIAAPITKRRIGSSPAQVETKCCAPLSGHSGTRVWIHPSRLVLPRRHSFLCAPGSRGGSSGEGKRPCSTDPQCPAYASATEPMLPASHEPGGRARTKRAARGCGGDIVSARPREQERR